MPHLPHWTLATLMSLASIVPALSQEAKPPVAGQNPPTVTERLSKAVKSVIGDPLAKADTDMRRVLDALAELDPKPIETLSAEEARKQPTPTDAVKSAAEG